MTYCSHGASPSGAESDGGVVIRPPVPEDLGRLGFRPTSIEMERYIGEHAE